MSTLYVFTPPLSGSSRDNERSLCVKQSSRDVMDHLEIDRWHRIGMGHPGDERDAAACACAAKLNALHDKSPNHGAKYGLIDFVDCSYFFCSSCIRVRNGYSPEIDVLHWGPLVVTIATQSMGNGINARAREAYSQCHGGIGDNEIPQRVLRRG